MLLTHAGNVPGKEKAAPIRVRTQSARQLRSVGKTKRTEREGKASKSA